MQGSPRFRQPGQVSRRQGPGAGAGPAGDSTICNGRFHRLLIGASVNVRS